jgi:hypothetical protein
MGRDYLYLAPSDSGDFWERDGGFVFGLVRKLLGPNVGAQDAEDAAAEIFERLLVAENDQGQNILAQYSAGYTSARTGKPVTWRGFLSGKVALYVRGKRESISRRNGREILLCDAEMGDGGERWVELFGGEIWDDYPSLTDAEFTDRMRDYLATVPDAWDGPGSLFAVFNEIIERIKSGEKATQVAGLSRKDTARALARIREVLAEVGTKPAPAPISVCGVVLSPAEARDALDRLRGASGNHVHRALAGHRLMAEGEKGWYHEFSRAELKAFPECAVDSREGKIGGAGAGHVKEAVMHGLARMLAGVPEPASAPIAAKVQPELPDELSREELFEAELWRITGLDADRIDAIIAAAQKVYA